MERVFWESPIRIFPRRPTNVHPFLLRRLPQLDLTNPRPKSHLKHWAEESWYESGTGRRWAQESCEPGAPAGQTQHLARTKRRRGNGSKPRGQPSLIATIIDTGSTQSWTTYETHSRDSKRISSTDLGGANARRTVQDLVDVRKASAHRARSHNQNLVSRRAAVASKKEADPTPRTKTSRQALRQMRTGRTGSLPHRPRPSWSSGR